MRFFRSHQGNLQLSLLIPMPTASVRVRPVLVHVLVCRVLVPALVVEWASKEMGFDHEFVAQGLPSSEDS